MRLSRPKSRPRKDCIFVNGQWIRIESGDEKINDNLKKNEITPSENFEYFTLGFYLGNDTLQMNDIIQFPTQVNNYNFWNTF
tara:strand:- start:759 stop:1004 length:246 start_codon:yes stop_codon:yes gene_type:complete